MMSDFKAEMTTFDFHFYSASTDSRAGFKKPTSKGKDRDGWEEETGCMGGGCSQFSPSRCPVTGSADLTSWNVLPDRLRYPTRRYDRFRRKLLNNGIIICESLNTLSAVEMLYDSSLAIYSELIYFAKDLIWSYPKQGYNWANGQFVWLVRSPGTVYNWTFVRHLHYQR